MMVSGLTYDHFVIVRVLNSLNKIANYLAGYADSFDKGCFT